MEKVINFPVNKEFVFLLVAGSMGKNFITKDIKDNGIDMLALNEKQVINELYSMIQETLNIPIFNTIKMHLKARVDYLLKN